MQKPEETKFVIQDQGQYILDQCDLELSVDFDKCCFTGQQTFYLSVLSQSNVIILNALKNLIINKKKTNFLYSNSEVIEVYYVNQDDIPNKARVVFQKSLPANITGFLHLDFLANLNHEPHGFVKKFYIGPKGEKKMFIHSNFKPCLDKKFFPSFGEQNMICKFNMAVRTSNKFTVVSNLEVQEVISIHDTFDKPRVVFKCLNKICAESVEVVIGNFVCTSSQKDEKIHIAIYSLNGRQKQGRLALEISEKAIKFFSLFLNVPFPSTKLDIVALKNLAPEVFESCGLLVVDENQIVTDLLYSADNYSIIVNVAYYVARQWILHYKKTELKNLDSALAILLANFFISETLPDNGDSIRCLLSNYLKKIHSGYFHAADIPTINIASVLKMMFYLVTSDNFKTSLKLYLENQLQSDSDAEVPDFWTILENVSGIEIRKIKTPCSLELEFPVLKVSEIFTFDSLLQRKLSLNLSGCLPNENLNFSISKIPVFVCCEENSSENSVKVLMDTESKLVELPISKNSWITVNSCYFLTVYDDVLLDKLILGIKNKTLPPGDRLRLLKDIYITFQMDQLSLVQVLQVLMAFKNEDSFIIWKEIVAVLNQVECFMVHSKDTIEQFKFFVCYLLKNCFARLGWYQKAEESDNDISLRLLIINSLIDTGNKKILTEVGKVFKEPKARAKLSFELEIASYKLAMMLDGNFDNLINIYSAAVREEERKSILTAFGRVQDELLKKVLIYAKKLEHFEDTFIILYSMTETSKGKETAWQYFKNNFDNIKLNNDDFLKFIEKNTSGSKKIAKDCASFFKNKTLTEYKKNKIDKMIKNSLIKAAQLDKEKKNVLKFFQNYSCDE